MVDSKKVYKDIENKIMKINSEIILPKNINKDVAENINKSSNQVKRILKNLQAEIKNLEFNSEWEHYTISFIGETNAGKSTIIESLRIKYEEEEKKKDYKINQEILNEKNLLLEKLEVGEKQFNSQKQSTTEKQMSQLKTYLDKVDEEKKSLLFKVRKFFQKDYEPYNSLILALKKDIETNSLRKFDDIEYVINDRTRLNKISNLIKYDGEIIGTGKLDYTQTSKTFFVKINNELVKIIDVPGIEGDEQNYEQEIKNAVSKSHCVFYVTSSVKTLESGTLSKVKKYIKDQADVYAIVNFRLNTYKEEYVNLSFEEIYKNKLEAIDSISKQLQLELKNNFINIVPVNGHWGFLSLSKYLEKDGEKQKLSSDKIKLLNIFQNESVIYRKSNFEKFENIILDTLNQKESKIRKTNILKINTLLDSLIKDLQENLNTFLSIRFLEDIKEQSEVSKRELTSNYNDFNRNLHSLRTRLLNEFKRESFKEIDDFVQSNDINENVYKVGIKRILDKHSSLLQQNIESNLKEIHEKINKQIEKSLKKFLDRLDTMSKMNNISFTNPNLNLSFDFFRSDLIKIGSVLFSVGGLAWAGFTLGSIFPVIGNIVGAIIGGLLGLSFELFRNLFSSVTSRKSKILMKVNEQLNQQSQQLDKQLQKEFDTISEEIKKNLINESITLIDELMGMYQLRRNKITEVVIELDNLKISN